jgi:hypothetical protein
MVSHCKFLRRVALFFGTEMNNPSSNLAWNKSKCISIGRYQSKSMFMLYTSLHTTQSPKTATHSSNSKSVIHSPKPNIYKSFVRYEARLFPCKIWGEVCYLFYEKTHVQQKATLFIEDESILFFKKRGLKNSASFFGFPNRRVRACVNRVPKTKVVKWKFVRSCTWCGVKFSLCTKSKSSPTNRIWPHRSSVALGIETVLMEMISIKLYWLNKTIFELLYEGGRSKVCTELHTFDSFTCLGAVVGGFQTLPYLQLEALPLFQLSMKTHDMCVLWNFYNNGVQRLSMNFWYHKGFIKEPPPLNGPPAFYEKDPLTTFGWL